MKHTITSGLVILLFAAGCGDTTSTQVISSESYYFQGTQAFDEKDFDEAISQLTEALDQGGLNVDSLCDARMKRAKARMETGEYEDAQEDLEFLLEGAPDTTQVLVAMAELSAKQGNLDEAKSNYQKARKENPRLVIPPEFR